MARYTAALNGLNAKFNPVLSRRFSYKPLAIGLTGLTLAAGLIYAAKEYGADIGNYFSGSASPPIDSGMGSGVTLTPSPETVFTPSSEPSVSLSPSPSPEALPSSSPSPEALPSPSPAASESTKIIDTEFTDSSKTGFTPKGGLPDRYEFDLLFEKGYVTDLPDGMSTREYADNLLSSYVPEGRGPLSENEMDRFRESVQKMASTKIDGAYHKVPTLEAMKADPYLYGWNGMSDTVASLNRTLLETGERLVDRSMAMAQTAQIGAIMTFQGLKDSYSSAISNLKERTDYARNYINGFTRGLRHVFA